MQALGKHQFCAKGIWGRISKLTLPATAESRIFAAKDLFPLRSSILNHAVEYFAGNVQALAWARAGQERRYGRANREAGKVTQLLDVLQGINIREMGQVPGSAPGER
jgi:hypothetical protein